MMYYNLIGFYYSFSVIPDIFEHFFSSIIKNIYDYNITSV